MKQPIQKQPVLKQPIHLRIFFSFAAVLLASILITMLFGNQLMEQLYLKSKTSDLETACSSITDVLLERDCDLTMVEDFRDALYEIEKNNINIMLLTMDQHQIYVSYYSRENWLSDVFRPSMPMDTCTSTFAMNAVPIDPFRSSPRQWIDDAARAGVFQTASLPLLITEQSEHQPGKGTLDYYGKISASDKTVYIFLRTPQEPISLAASLAVKYNLYLALISFLFTAIMSYFLARRVTRPIEQIQQHTDRISRMDFSQPCEVKTGDELEALSHNINQMSEKLQDSIVQMQINQQLLEKDLEREAKTNELRREFIANVSHDFKTPLTLIRAYTETLRNQALTTEEQKQYCDIILTESSRMNRLVTQLLQLSKLESGIVELELSWFPVEELMREILHNNQLPIQQNHLQIQWNCGGQEHIVQGDYPRIEQALINLLENAIKYTPERGQIIIQTETLPDNLCRIAITNTSQPLTDEQLEHLFISFYKADESRHLDQQSFGLGLAIVKATMDLHGQSCTACNTPEGLQIAFILPLLPEADEDEDE